MPDGIPMIVPKELFDRVQEKLEKNRKAPARHKAEDDYLLTISPVVHQKHRLVFLRFLCALYVKW